VSNLSLVQLRHLRDLSLAYNPLTDLSGLHFPEHLRRLDISHCALTILNHCQFSALADLSYIGLSGNDLKVRLTSVTMTLR
jgi:Leucine-rich repeat (LRR) protein